MPISAAIQRTLFEDKGGVNGGGTHSAIIKNRFLSFLIWQFLLSTFILVLKTIFLSPFVGKPFSPTLLSPLSFLVFHFCLLLVSTSFFFLSSPYFLPFASPIEISLAVLRLIFMYGSRNSPGLSKVRVSLAFVLFVTLCGVAGAFLVICSCWGCDVYYLASGSDVTVIFANLGFKGFVVGLFYGLHYVYRQRWVLRFPIIQRPPFFSFKMGIPQAVVRAVKVSAVGCFLSTLIAFFLPTEYQMHTPMSQFIAEQMVVYIGSFLVILCWELSNHLHQVLHTKRFVFAPTKGSAAAETNPSEQLLATLEESTPKSLLQYLAYLDLCMTCENNVDTWRRAAFFEETGETYKRIIGVCLKPLENFNEKLAQYIESSSGDNSLQFSHQFNSPTIQSTGLKLSESFYDTQLSAWCARIVASLTARSRKEDKFGVAQLSGSNAAVISTLLSSLLAVETLMGKKTNIPSPLQMGAAGIKWASMNTGIRQSAAGATGKIRGSPLYAKAYSLADIFKVSIYCVVSAFHDEMLNSGKAGLLEKDWISSTKPLYGTRELLIQKLHLFLDFQAN